MTLAHHTRLALRLVPVVAALAGVYSLIALTVRDRLEAL